MQTVTNPYRILYVDDEEGLLDIGRFYLEQAGGITVDVTASPHEALHMILSGRYDAVVSDYQMPEMNGIELLKRVREAGSRVPFIIFTGKGREEVVIEALNSGADFYIQKGGNPGAQFAELANAVRQLAGRQRAEAAVRKGEEMLHKAQKLAHLGSWEFDHESRRLIWSDEVYRIFGLDPGKPPTYEEFLAMVHPDDRAAVDAAYSTSVAEAKAGYEVEHRIIRKDTGEVRYLVERCEHQRDESGRVRRSVGMIHDITELKLAELEQRSQHEKLQAAYEQLAAVEEELRSSFDDLAESQRQLQASEERYRRLAENAGDIIFRVEFLPEFRFVYINPAVTRILGYTLDEIYADAGLAKRVVHPDDHSLITLLNDCSITERLLTLRLVRKDGSVVWVELHCTPIIDPSGRVVALEGIGRDVSEAKQEHERLLESEGRVRKKLESILFPKGDIGDLELDDIIDVPVVQSLVDNFYSLAKIPIVIADIRGRLLIGAGWHEICIKYHRAHPETRKHCVESDTILSTGIPAGESRLYRCRNNLWDMATPIFVDGRHLGNVFTGQFFFEDEEVDYEFFRAQARRYGFDEEGYLAALKAVPRLDRAYLDAVMGFLSKFAALISRLSYANITLARSLVERDRLMGSLEETASRLARTQEIAHLGSWEFDYESRRLSWSDEVYRIFGLEPGEPPTYEEFLAMVHPDDRAAVDAVYSTSVAEAKAGYEVKHRIIRKDTGEVRYLVERCEHQRDESGQIVRSVGMVHDITELKLAELELRSQHEKLQVAYEQLAVVEKELRSSFDDLAESQRQLQASEERYRRISESISDVVYSCVLKHSGNYRFDWVAGAVHEITGYTEDEILAMRCWRKIIHPDDMPIFERETLRLPPGTSSLFEIRIVRRDSRVRWLRVSANCTDTADGEIRLYGGWQDITDQKEAEERLRKTAEKMESIFRAAPTGIGMAVDGVMTEVNGRLCEILGYTRDELIGQHVQLLCPDDTVYESALQQMHARVEVTGKCTLETRFRRKDGAIIDVLLSITPLDPMHFSWGVTFTVQDITERKAMEREIEYHARELARQTNSLAIANRKLNLMSSITRHDILNQLTILLGNLWIAEETGAGQNISEYLARVKGAAGRIHRQIEFTRDYTDLGVRSPEWQRVSDLIRSAVHQDLPVDDETRDLVIYADPMLETVFANLMDNTLRHGESATGVRVRYRLEENGDLTLIWEDDGVGIPVEEKERIFQRGVGKNTGLGLFLIREILAITGINIAETGEPGKGARFEMLVPRGAYKILG